VLEISTHGVFIIIFVSVSCSNKIGGTHKVFTISTAVGRYF
jgi:hypothetical protein